MDLTFTETNIKIVSSFYGAIDFVFKEVCTPQVNANFYYIDGMMDTKQVELSILQPLMEYDKPFEKSIEGLRSILYSSCPIKKSLDIDSAIDSISSGDMVMLMEGSDDLIVFSARKANSRAVTEPPTSSVIKGPREGFTEDIKTNMLLLRRKVRSNKLVFESVTLGRYTQTTIVFAYVKGIANPTILDKIKERLSLYEIDGVIDSSFITKMLEAYPYSLFKQVGNSEKPDVIATKLLDARIAIIVDGSPLVLTVPFLLIEDFEDSQDMYKRASRVNFIRSMRIFAVFFAVLLPGLFVAVRLHQYQIIPLQMLITILNSIAALPFTPTIEMLVALLLFEILGEASVRMPRHIGMALSVVGALVLGETAVKAGLLSTLTVLVVALSGIGIYAVPDEVGTLSQLRLLFVVVGGLLGFYGILLFCWAIFAYLSTLDTFSVPYLAPFSPIISRDLQDAIIKRNIINKTHRTSVMSIFNKIRIKKHEQGEIK